MPSQHIAGLPVEELLLAAAAAAAPMIALVGWELRSRLNRFRTWLRQRGRGRAEPGPNRRGEPGQDRWGEAGLDRRGGPGRDRRGVPAADRGGPAPAGAADSGGVAGRLPGSGSAGGEEAATLGGHE